MGTVLLFPFLSLCCSAKGPFASGPHAALSPAGIRISFTLAEKGDVEVAVVSKSGEVVRHLAAGLLGSERAAEPLRPRTLSQSLLWDWKDDRGRELPRNPGAYRVRIRTHLRPTFGATFGPQFHLFERIYGLATDNAGNLYVATGGLYLTPLFWIVVFDRQGNYLKTIMPFSPHLPYERVKGFGVQRKGNAWIPRNFHPLEPRLYESGIVTFLSNTVREESLGILTEDGRLARVGTDGSCLRFAQAVRTAIRPSGGPLCVAETPKGDAIYVTGLWSPERKGRPRRFADGTVYKVDPETGRMEVFLSLPVPEKSFWLTERNGWYHFTNWGRKNGCAALHGMAVDPEGRLFVCDRVNHRIAVFTPDGHFHAEVTVRWPDAVAFGRDRNTLYVLCRRVIDGYKARNTLELVKIEPWQKGTIRSRLSLEGRNAPSLAVDTHSDPSVLWVGCANDAVLRIEDRGGSFAVTGALPLRKPNGPAVVKVWASPDSEAVFVNNGWNGLARYDGATGSGGPIPLTGIDLAVGPDGLLYVFGRRGWREPIYRCDMNFKPVPFSGTGKPTTGPPPPGGQDTVYGRYGTGWSNKGLAVGPDGRIFVRHMYTWTKYYVTVFGPDGLAQPGGRTAGGLIAPVDGRSGGICVDRKGCLYLGMDGAPRGLPPARRREGCVVKFLPQGGGRVPKPRTWNPAENVLDWGDTIVEGAVCAYPHLAPLADTGCVCKEARFDLDDYGRLYVPNVLDFCVRVYDNAGNLLCRLGSYGTRDCTGPQSAIPDPPIPLGWPMSCAVNRAGHLFVADVLNQRVVKVDLRYAQQVTLPLTR